MASLIPFIRVPDVGHAKSWYESIGFSCIGTHNEPGCGLDWAMMTLSGANFMLYTHSENSVANANNCGLYFYLDSLDGLQEKLEGKAMIIETVDRTQYGRKEITCKDCYGFQITFSSEADS